MAAFPFLTLPPSEEITPEIYHLSLYSVTQKNLYKLNLPPTLQNCRCVGSSHRWLAFVDETDNPFLLNPFSRSTIINLPPKPNIQKVVLSKNPLAKTNVVILVLYSLGFQTKIAFCRIGDQQWTDLDYSKGRKTYYDIVCCDKTNTVFALGPGPSVEFWDLTESTPKKRMILLQHPLEPDCSKTFPRDLYSSHWYLATSLGKIFLVMRYIGDFVRYDGEVVCKGDTLTEPYKTIDFRVFKFDVGRKMWIRVDSLEDFSMFVGGNETVMVSHPELKRNAIYFTDDYWENIDADYSYGGHDMGIYKLEDGCIDAILDIHQQKIQPPPFWIV